MIEKVVASLTKAQRAYLLAASQAFPSAKFQTFPPPNTHGVLMTKRLVEYNGSLTPLGLAVRNHILGESE